MSVNLILFLCVITLACCVASADQQGFRVKEMIVPQKLGNYTFGVSLGAPPCGTPLASFNGIESYSNGEYQGTGWSCGDWTGTGYQFQCVEYTQRYFNYLYGVRPVWPVNFAKEMCYAYPAGMSSVGSPNVGDAVVFNWGDYGQTAVIIGVGGGIIDVIEENGSSYGTNSYYTGDVECYLRFTGFKGDEKPSPKIEFKLSAVKK